MRKSERLAKIAVLFLLWPLGVSAQPGGGADHWVTTWMVASIGRPQTAGTSAAAPNSPASIDFSNQTLREIVHVSLGGSRTRVVLSNAFGTRPLIVGAANLGIRERDSSLASSSGRPLTFAGKPSATIPAGAILLSDPVDLQVPPLADLAIDVYLPGDTNAASPLTMHAGAHQTNYVSAPGNHAGKQDFPVVMTMQSWFVLARVEVAAPESVGVVVALGDSITDGARTTSDTNNRWPDHLARRLMSASGGARMATANAAIAGNRVLNEANIVMGINALARFDRDVLGTSGATHVVVLEGINDIGMMPSAGADDVISGHRQLIERAHAHKLRIYGATLTPFEGHSTFTADNEAKRQAVNQWIRTSSAYDGVIDFDAATRDPDRAARLLERYDSGDHLHPNDAGQRAMADAIDLTLFSTASATTDRTKP